MRNKKRVLHEVVLAVLMIIVWVIVNPSGEFPINDDFAYSMPVKVYLETGKVYFHPWSAVNFVTQYYLGIGWCKILGYSLYNLRLLNFLAYVITIICCFRFFSSLLDVRRSFVLGMIIAIHPVFFFSGFTFMTEPIFTLLVTLSFICLFNYFDTFKRHYIIVGLLAALFAFFLRQNAVFIFVAYAGVLIASSIRRLLSKEHLLQASIYFSLVLLFAVGLTLLKQKAYVSESQAFAKVENLKNILGRGYVYAVFRIIFCFYGYVIYLVLPLLPILIFYFTNISNRIGRLTLLSILILSGFFTIVFVKANLAFPFFSNTLSYRGIGPVLINGYSDTGLLMIKYLVTFLVLFVSNVCFVLVALVLGRPLTLKYSMSKVSVQHLFWIFYIITYIGIISLVYPFDRYIVPILPAFFIGFVFLLKQHIENLSRRIEMGVTILVFIQFLVVGLLVRDYFFLQRARWTLLENVKVKSLNPQLVDGGFEFNGSYTYTKTFSRAPFNWWWVSDNQYMISARRTDGFNVIEKQPANGVLSRQGDTVYLLKRIN